LLGASGGTGMRRVAMAFLVAGGLAAFAGTVVPDPDPSDHGPLLALGVACLALAAGLAAWRRPPEPVLASLPAAGLVLAGVAVAIAEPLASTPTYALLPILASAYYGTPRRLAVETAAYLVGLAVVMALWVDPGVRGAVYIGTVIPAVCVALVVSVLKQRLAAHVDGLHHRAATDPLTGLLNHGAFGAALESAVERCRAAGEPAALLLLDIDHFKQVNDRFGHQHGDQTLRVVSEVLAAHKRRGDLLGRVGGEEFALLLPDAGKDAAHRVAERVRTAVRAATAGTQSPLTVSIGIASWSPTVATSHDLLQAADRALYAAKARGRDRAVDLGQATRPVAA
jgi:diguanylate cyclase (GGDEF)-like protein